MLGSWNHGCDTNGYLVAQSFPQRSTYRQSKVFVEGALHKNHRLSEWPLIVAAADGAIEVPVLATAMNAIGRIGGKCCFGQPSAATHAGATTWK
jgi:hypothetical protein